MSGNVYRYFVLFWDFSSLKRTYIAIVYTSPFTVSTFVTLLGYILEYVNYLHIVD